MTLLYLDRWLKDINVLMADKQELELHQGHRACWYGLILGLLAMKTHCGHISIHKRPGLWVISRTVHKKNSCFSDSPSRCTYTQGGSGEGGDLREHSITCQIAQAGLQSLLIRSVRILSISPSPLTCTPRMPKIMKKAQQMTTMLPMGFRDDIRVSTTSFRPGALLITLEHGTQWGISALCVCGGLCRTLLGQLLCSPHQMENGCLQRSNPQPHHAPYHPGLHFRHF